MPSGPNPLLHPACLQFGVRSMIARPGKRLQHGCVPGPPLHVHMQSDQESMPSSSAFLQAHMTGLGALRVHSAANTLHLQSGLDAVTFGGKLMIFFYTGESAAVLP